MSEELYRATVRITPDMTGFDEEARAGIDAGVPDRKDVKVGADTGEAQTKIVALDEEVKKLDRDASSASRSLHGFGGGLSGIGVTTAALLPAMPALAGGIGALAGALTAAGAASIGFGAVFATGIHQATKANQELLAAQKTVNDSTNPQARQLALEKQAALIHQLGPATIAFGQALHDVSQTWTGFADSFIPLELQFVSGFEKLEKDVLPQLKPLISGTFGVARDELTKLDAAVNSPGGHSFFSWLSVEGPRDVRALTDGLGHFAAGFGHLLVAFTPVEHQLVDGFEHIGAKFAAATSGLDRNGGFQKFLATVEKDGPMLVHTLGDAASAIGHIGMSLSPVLPLELKFVDSIARLVSAHPAIAGALGAMFLGFQALKVINTITGPLQTVVGFAAKGGILRDFAASETLVGDAAEGATGKVAALGVAEDAAIGKAAALRGALAGLAALPLLGVGAVSDTMNGTATSQSGSDQLDALAAQVAQENHVIQNYKPGKFGEKAQPLSKQDALTLIQDFGNSTELDQLYQLTGGEYGRQFTAQVAGGHLLGPTAAQGDTGNPVANLLVPFAENVRGIAKDVTSPEVTDYAKFMGGLNNPANMLPLSSGGSSAAAKQAQNNAAAAAYLLGISIPQNLAQGIANGTNPLTATFQNLNQKLTGTAQTLANSLESTFNTALQYGQQVSQSLIPNVVSGLPQMGKSYTVSFDKNGKLVKTEDSPILGGLQLTLANDKQFVADIGKAKKLGLNSTILNQFVQAGPGSEPQLDQLVNGSPSDIAQINSVYGQITGLGNQFGYQQAMAQGIQEAVAELKALIVAVGQQAPATGQAVAAALNGVAKTAQLQAASTPSKGVLAR